MGIDGFGLVQGKSTEKRRRSMASCDMQWQVSARDWIGVMSGNEQLINKTDLYNAPETDEPLLYLELIGSSDSVATFP